MSKLLSLLTGNSTSLIDKAVEVADKFIETPEEKKAFIEKAYEQEVEDRRAARDQGKKKASLPHLAGWRNQSVRELASIARQQICRSVQKYQDEHTRCPF